jgi:crossover junction endodeoxyribonuclease RuvC
LIIGIDPGSRLCGFGVFKPGLSNKPQFVTYGAIQLDLNSTFNQRLGELGTTLAELFAKYPPTVLVIEKIFLAKNADSAFKLGHARGIAICEAVKVGASIAEYTPTEIKKSIAGNGHASKEELKTALLRQMEMRVEGKGIVWDASDALALAYHHSLRSINDRIFKGSDLRP